MNYDSSTPTVRQTDPWSCSVASVTWLLHSLGIDADYPTMEQVEQAAGLVSPDLGLLDGSGGALARWLCNTYDLDAASVPVANWAWLQATAGTMPILIGGHGWNHWVGVRSANGYLQLANPADGWMGVHQVMTVEDFRRLGPFSAVYVPVVTDAPEEDVSKIEELESLVGVLRDAGRVAREGIEEALAVPRLPKAARTALEAGALPAAQTVERGG